MFLLSLKASPWFQVKCYDSTKDFTPNHFSIFGLCQKMTTGPVGTWIKVSHSAHKNIQK